MMLDAFKKHLESTQILPVGSKIVVAYSGGADSGCLLRLLSHPELIDWQFEIIAAHLHHGQREEADKELKLCEAQCNEWGVAFVSGRADVPLIAEQMKIGVEEAGRHARYNFLNQVLGRFQFDTISTAHTKTENVETALFNLIRGSGPSGLIGIPSKRDRITRPLLEFTREETRTFCSDHGIWFHDDPTNDQIEFSRARIRHRIVPELNLINPQAEEAISRFMSILEEEDRFLNGAAAAALEQSEVKLNGPLNFLTSQSEIAFDRTKLESLPAVLLKRALRLSFEFFGSTLDFRQTEILAEWFRTGENGSITPEEAQSVGELRKDRFHVRELETSAPFRFKLTVPGETESEHFGWKFIAFESEPSHQRNQRNGMEVQIDADKVQGELFFRSFQSGDVIQPLGFEGHRKISDLYGEAGLTAAARTRLPIICDFVGPIWVPGVSLSNKIDKDETTQRVLVLSFRPLNAS
jgi:tRNA(Ile)-lysidine synthase